MPNPTPPPRQDPAAQPVAPPDTQADTQADTRTIGRLIPLCVVGGLLMGVANVVPGISGGAMLLLLGVYTLFLTSIADLASLRWSKRAIFVVGTIGFGALTSIVLLAGPIKWLIINYRWEVYSVLIGMRLGVIPTVWRLARPPTPTLWIGFAAGLALTAAAAVFKYNPELIGGAGTGPLMFFVGGLLAASATILPGLDGSYLLMLLGLYVPILGAIADFKSAVVAGDLSAAGTALFKLAPVAVGAAIGIGGVAILLKRLFARHPKPTYGLLMGVLCGAFVGLYPFANFVPPKVGSTVKGVSVTEANLAAIPQDDWPLAFFAPTPGQMLGCLALIVAGLVAALLLDKLDSRDR